MFTFSVKCKLLCLIAFLSVIKRIVVVLRVNMGTQCSYQYRIHRKPLAEHAMTNHRLTIGPDKNAGFKALSNDFFHSFDLSKQQWISHSVIYEVNLLWTTV